MSNKKVKEYLDKYGDIPSNMSERFNYVLQALNIKDKDIPEIRKRIKKALQMKYDEISFVFYFTPQATPRPRYSRFTKAFYVKNHLNYNELFKKFLDENNVEFKISTPCEFYCKTFFPIPSSMNRIEKVLAELGLIKHVSKPDWDNLGKTYSDMVQKHLILDDAMIYKGCTEKLYSFKPRIEIRIRFMTEFDSKYNENKLKK